MSLDRVIQGGCHCGAIRYALSAPPAGSMICHCASCRRLTGAPATAWLSVAADAFAVTRGAPALYASSPGRARQFCAACGTHVAYAVAGEDDYVEVSTCTLDDPNAFPPTHHSWLSHDLAWVKFGDGLPTFAKGRYDAG